jgi:uncharacterized protein YbaP (TraB family)
MNKFCFLSVACLFLFLTNANAQIFWKISDKGNNKVSYILGTHHLIEKSKIKDFDKISNICSNADLIVGEVNLNDKTVQEKISKGSIMTDKTIQELLSVEDYKLIDSCFNIVMGVGLDKLGRYKPMMLNSIYTIMLYIKMNGLSSQPEPVDMTFQKIAIDNNKMIAGLETVDDQVDLLYNKLSLKRQAELLVESVKDSDNAEDLLKRLNNAYLSGNLEDLDALLKVEQGSITPEEMYMLVENRNNNWMKKLPDLLSNQSCFVAVGCLHLTGKTGLINQLKKAGFKLEPVVF